MSTAQTIFAIALGALSILITWFIAYVAWTTVWSDRWYGKR